MGVTRVNLSDGQYRDLDKPLVESDPDASTSSRVGNWLLKGLLVTMGGAGMLLCLATLIAFLASR